MEKKVGIITLDTEIGREFHQRGGDEWIYGLVVNS
jgi:hypothetical protein